MATSMTRSSRQTYQFDRLFMSHLASTLRPEYATLVTDPLPLRQWELLLDLEIAHATSDPEGGKRMLRGDTAGASPPTRR